MTWLTNWNYRKPITISNTGSLLSDYQTIVTIDTATLVTAGKLLSNCSDIRFTLSDGSTLLNYWIESGSNTPSTKIWVKMQSILTGSNTIYLYYDNIFATSMSSYTDVFMYATGGNITYSGDYTINTFSTSGTFMPNFTGNVWVLVVAGGGGGGTGVGGGGGGGGGVINNTAYSISGSTFVTVGNGGGFDTNGQNSIFGTLTAIGGGAGGQAFSWSSAEAGHAGGSGGGGGGEYYTSRAGGTATSGQGYNGGTGIILTSHMNYYGGGGGGGAGGTGTDSGSQSQKAGNGGSGILNSITGTAIYYAGGGGGRAHDVYNASTGSGATAVGGTGGIGGGGNGSYHWETGPVEHNGTDGAVNTGGGGGGANATTGSGGSGIVIVRYINRTIASPEPTLFSIGTEEVLASPANIIAVNMTIAPSENPCRTGICTISVSVTWTNNGGLTGSFTPSITASSGTVTPVYPSEQLNADVTITHSFMVSDMTIGTCSICPNPN